MAYTKKVITSGKYQMIILDEIFIAIHRGLLEVSQVVDVIREKPDTVELVLTGRKAPPEILELADYVTEMQMQKHPYTRGIKARKGIEH